MSEALPARAEYRVATFYRFTALPGLAALRASLARTCSDYGVKGTILLAAEGVNGTIAGRPEGVGAVLERLRREPPLADMVARLSHCDEPPFKRMKIKWRHEIVTLGVDGIDPGAETGVHVDPADWNALIARDDVVVIDARNDYEVDIGSFTGARDPRTARFGDLPAWIDAQADLVSRPPVAMFCTGGIRCEKATAYLRQRGFDEVYQLDGGILNYLDSVPEDQSSWRGECFVFDERVSLVHGLAPGSYRLCDGCGGPVPARGDGACGRCENRPDQGPFTRR